MAVLTIQTATLILKNERHSKQYNVEIVKNGRGYFVNFQFGAIGKSLQPGTKTKTSVTREEAQTIFDKLIAEKTGKRCDCCGGQYVPSGFTPAQSSPVARRAITSPESDSTPVSAPRRFDPELLEPIDTPPTSTLPDRYTTNPQYGAQKKYDGIRLAVRFDGHLCQGFNRKGEQVTVPECVELAIRNQGTKPPIPVMLDGEWISTAGHYVAFDLLEAFGEDIRQEPYINRFHQLSDLFGYESESNGGCLRVAALYITTTAKLGLLKREVDEAGEGVVYKKLSAAYMPGRRGVNIKRKLWASATVRVCTKKKEDGKNSFAMEMWAGHSWTEVGTVTLTKTVDMPKPGTYREVKYLYLGAGGRMVQAEDLGPRTDVDDSDCAIFQCKRKQVGELVSA
jgi:bifunctional non-homologous end joining protein LigD